ncbi:MAG: hypothetical protein HQL82_14400 [Magnetococcales bacterium]|nr:hypothetical protein [Magnetococcales bacterium]
MNRLELASQGFNAKVAETEYGWFLVGFMLLLAVYLGGYLVQRHLERRKTQHKPLTMTQGRKLVRHK